MRLAVVGVGTAGSRIVNQIVECEASVGRALSAGNVLLVNSRPPSFDTTEHVPEERRVTIGDAHGAVDGAGTDGDPDLGAEVARQERGELVRAFDLIEFHQVDGVLVVAGLAGGTGGGAGAVVVDRLQAICDEPVYALGVLPDESEGQGAALTAARSLQSFVDRADNVIAFDNDAWRTDEPAETGTGTGSTTATEATAPTGAEGTAGETDATDDFSRLNAALARRLVTLFAAGEFAEASPENRLDPSDITRTLESGGISTIGYASTEVSRTGVVRSVLGALRGLLPWTSRPETGESESTDAAKITRLVRRAARSKLTLPCSVSSADRALILLSGPPRLLSRKGFESGRYWLEGEADIVDVKAGDEPHDQSRALTAAVLFSNVTDVPRIDAIQAQALDGLNASESEGEGESGDERGEDENNGWERFETAEPR